MSTMSSVRAPSLTQRLGDLFYSLLAALSARRALATAAPANLAAEREMQRLGHFIIAAVAVVAVSLAPDFASAAGGGFLPSDTNQFRTDVKGTWTLVSFIAIFLGLVVMVIGMFLPIASWLKWGAIGGVIVGAFGQSIVEWLYATGGNSGGITGASGTS